MSEVELSRAYEMKQRIAPPHSSRGEPTDHRLEELEQCRLLVWRCEGIGTIDLEHLLVLLFALETVGSGGVVQFAHLD